MHLNAENVKKIAELARIKVTPEDIDIILNQLSGILDWIDQLQNVDTSHLDDSFDLQKPSMHEREDLIINTSEVAEVLANAPMQKHNMFAVPKMVE